MQQIRTRTELDEIFTRDLAVLLKHSTRCPISGYAFAELLELLARRPGVPVFVLDVHASRDLSNHVAERLRIVHHSPQAIVLVRGEPVWVASHFDVRLEAVLEQLDGEGAGTP